MRPDAITPESPRWQQRKAAETRQKILDSAVDCIVEKGYSRLSINEVAARAGVSRGAMHHHFTNRMALVAALIDYTFYHRMRFLLDNYRSADGLEDAAREVTAAAEFHWQSFQTREFAASMQLAVAARSDPELNAAYEPASRRYDQIWTEEVFPAFPQWKGRAAALQLASDFAIVAHMGLAIHLPVLDVNNRAATIRALVASVVRLLQSGELEVPAQSELPPSTRSSAPVVNADRSDAR